MNDMTQVIAPKSDQINADDLIAGPMTIQITGVKVTPDSEQPVSISFAGSGKVYRPCKSMSRVLVAGWGADAKNYAGKSLTLYRDPSVKWGGLEVGGIRISHMSDLKRDMVMSLTMSKANRKPHQVKVLARPTAPQPQTAMTADVALSLATTAAYKGTEHFRTWFNTDEGKAARATGALTPAVMATMQATCSGADNLAARMAEDPFAPATDPARSSTATDDEINRQIEAEIAARDTQLEGGND